MAEDRSSGAGFDEDAAVFVISVAAQLAGMHPQTLRQYDRLGLVSPDRASGRGRRYSSRDVAMLREVQRLSQDDGVNLAGIKRILELETQVDALRRRVSELMDDLSRARTAADAQARVFTAAPSGDIVSVPWGKRPPRSAFGPGTSLVVWRPE
jgi:MerR family transcriptional regulator, heat shock protein HspR